MTKSEIRKMIREDKKVYRSNSFFHCLFDLIVCDNRLIYKKIIITSRKYNYYHEKGLIYIFQKLYYTRKLNILSRKYNINIKSLFGKHLKIFHENITINQYSILGDNITLHGNNCIGNDGKNLSKCPKIGNNVDIGYGATIIGNIELADNIVVGANSLVNKSFLEPNIVIAGVPAKKIKVLDVCDGDKI